MTKTQPMNDPSALYKVYLRKLTVIAVVLAIAFVGFFLLFPAMSNIWQGLSILFFFAVSAIVHRFLLKELDNPKKFVMRFMMTTTMKLLLYLSVILTFVLLNKSQAVAFVIAFLLFYIIFTVFEVRAFVRLNKSQQ